MYQVNPKYVEGRKLSTILGKLKKKASYCRVTSLLKQCKSGKNMGLYFWGCGSTPNKQ